ncbi:MAG TPA: PRC-barrel domain-containing protein [Xanthobacteraceae bacterium]|nr:PRC-barrel domain-containing protein [Xanthobacteraceae bacterium]
MIARKTLAAGLVLAAMTPALAQERQPLQLSLFSLRATAAYPLRQDSSQWLGSNLIGASVVSATSERIGKITNLILSDDGKVEAAVIKVGGFLGLGGKTVAVTYDSLNISRNDKGDAIDHVTIAATRDDLLRAASFKSLRQQLAQVRERR